MKFPARMEKAARLAQPWAAAMRNLLFPPQCDSCRRPQGPYLAGGRLCGSCYARLAPVQTPYCELCAEPFPAVVTHAFVCSNCEGRQLAFDFAFTPYVCQGPLRDMIHEFKYNKQQHLKEVLGTLLLNALHEPRIALRDDWMIVPVPLHSIRKRERGFNQSLELATVLQRGSQYPLMDGLRRTRYTTGQAHLNRKGRLENLRGAISLTATAASQHWFAGKSVLLIDDVLTTGATAHECAQVLKKQGAAERVVALSVARG